MFSGFTLGYWLSILFQWPQFIGLPITCFIALVCLLVSILRYSVTNDVDNITEYILGLYAFAVAIFVCTLFAFNPDDATFYHRVSHVISDFKAPLPSYETRLAFDKLPSISAAHLIPSWEYFLALIGSIVGVPLLGYQLGGTFISIVFFISASLYTLNHFQPKAGRTVQFSVVVGVAFCLFFDANANRRIGSWLILGGWTGKCFLAAALILLFPVIDRAVTSKASKDWFFLFCLIVFFLGLSGSALFILPIGILFAGISTYTFNTKSYSSFMLMLSAVVVPILVGGVFIYQFGGLHDDSYWRTTSTMPFGEYVRITFADRQIWLYVGLCAVISIRTQRKSLNFKAVKSLYSIKYY